MGSVFFNFKIMNEMSNSYANLYERKSIDQTIYMISTARHKMKMKKLNYTQPSVDECKEAVFDMKNNKFSGLDGIPCKFYKYIWSLIGCYFMKYY